MRQVSGIDELDEFILNGVDNNKVVVLYFGAVWCGPCKSLKERLVDPDTYKSMPRLSVCYLDVDDMENEDLVQKYNVEAFPTQIFIRVDKNRVVEVSRVEGYDFTKLKLEYDRYLS
jgi:protein disulfide-isomerase